jgi:hypothetical protein
MSRLTHLPFCFAILFPLAYGQALGQDAESIEGTWTLIPHKSTHLGWRTLSLEIDTSGDRVAIVSNWGRGRRTLSDTLDLKIGETNTVPVTHRVFVTNPTIGLKMLVGEPRYITAEWVEESTVLRVTEQAPAQGSQGRTEVRTTPTYSPTPEPGVISYEVERPTRPDPLKYLLKREGSRDAFYMEMSDEWTIDTDLPVQAFLISLQALANEDAPNLFFVYGEKWDFRFTPSVKEFLEEERFYTFQELSSAQQALNQFREHVGGYVVWDKDVRTSLIVAYTVAGLERAAVVSEELIPMMEEAGIPLVEDFRDRFAGQSDAEIYQWAYDQFWDRCSKDYIVWLGGEHGRTMRPGVADFGMKKRMFFSDLSNNPADTVEYNMVHRLFGEMNQNAIVMGWHSYAKDRERQHVRLASRYGHRIEGLHTLPNMSFMHQVPATPGFEFTNNHNVKPGQIIDPEEKVYVSAVQTDALGIGAWTRPGRGAIPYAWEVTMNWSWMAPTMMEFFYRGATPNDYFIAAPSAAGYMYPKAIPAELRPPALRKAKELMEKLDIVVFDIMDHSEGGTFEGNNELTKEVVDDYYETLPNAIGFVNGYGPSYTFTSRDGRPLLSFEYYLSQNTPVADATADILELARFNSKRPYFMVLHIRQWSDITRVVEILDGLGPEFEVVPLDVLLRMAGQRPTFEEQYRAADATTDE